MGFDYHGEQERHQADFYSTPAWATEAMLERVSLYGETWEPACGDGAIARLLPERVMATDLYYRGYGEGDVDFLSCITRKAVDNIVTNPPFRLAEEFVRKALTLTKRKVVMFLRLQFMESKKRYRLFQDTPLARVLVFSRRVSCGLGGEVYTGGKVAHAWFVWEHDHEGNPELEWIP